MLNQKNTLVLVIDIQERLLPALHQADAFVAACKKFITASTHLSLPIILTEQYPKGLGKTVADITALFPDVTTFEKTQFSAYTAEVQAALAAHSTQNMILLGCETHICVLQTALDLRQNGLNIWIPQECVTSRTDANKQNGLQQMRDAGIVVSNVESLLFQLLRDAKHPQFKTISKLIV